MLPGTLARRSGRIAVVASVTGYAALPRAEAYGATKAFLISMCDSLRADLSGSGVTITIINPGYVRTPLTAQNEFHMPFLIEADTAARVIADGLEAGRPEDRLPAANGARDEAPRLRAGVSRARRPHVSRGGSRR